MFSPEKLRNIAIIAHIDHGKTTLLDSLLKQSNVFRDNETVPDRVMDSYDQEKERGITIFAKHTSLFYGDCKINVIDTPGHADFSGEVERVLGLVNAVLLLVDAQEGPMPQTRFVLAAALKIGLKPIVIVNKIDRPRADPHAALNKTFDLFVELGANDEQLDFPFIFASGLSGFAVKELVDPQVDMRPLFDLMLHAVPPPTGHPDLPFLMQAVTLSYDEYVGRQACGRILQGSVRKGQPVARVDAQGHVTQHRVQRIEGYHGIKRQELDEAGVGDIVSIAGMPEVLIGDTLCDPEHIVQLPTIRVADPTVSIEIMVNTSPFAGKEGKHVTMNKIRERLLQEKRANISLLVDEHFRDDAVRVCGRGELHLAVLIEAMRREGYEFAISKPRVLLKEIKGALHEPYEMAHVEVPQDFSGTIIEELARRKGELQHLHTNEQGITALDFLIPTRGLMGYRNAFLTSTRGLGILTSTFAQFGQMLGDIARRVKGVMIANASGKSTAYALFGLQERGTLFLAPGEAVYEGMIVGEHSRENDLVVNATREKHLTNIRAAGSDENIILAPPRKMNLEQAIDFIEDDEWVEVTPRNIRLRKQYLKESERKRK